MSSRHDSPNKTNVHLVFHEDDKDLLEKLDLEVLRRKHRGEPKFNRNDLIKEMLQQLIAKNEK